MKEKYLIFLALLILLVGQVMSKIGSAQESLFNIFVLLGYIALILRGIIWLFVLKKFTLSFAYPFMSLSFVIILFISYYFFAEEITIFKIVGSLFIIFGVILTSKASSVKEG